MHALSDWFQLIAGLSIICVPWLLGVAVFVRWLFRRIF
jgi:hypothetical protein